MSSRSLNILVVASWYPSPSAPNEGSYVQEQARMLLKAGHHVTVLHPYMLGNFSTEAFKKSHISNVVSEGINEIRVGVAPVLPGFRVLSYKGGYRVVLKTLIAKGVSVASFDLIHSHSALLGGFIAQHLAKRFDIPLVHTEHASSYIFNPDQFTSAELKAVNTVFSQADALLFVSAFAQHKISTLFHGISAKLIKVIPNPVAPIYYQQPLSPTTIPTKFLMVGDNIPVKNHALLLRVWALFQQEHKDVHLTLVGKGLTIDHLVQEFPGLDLARITIIEQLTRAEMVEVMRGMHVVLSTSNVETFGLSIAEAQALGKPVVVTDSGGILDVVEQDTGTITEMSETAYLDGLRNTMKHYAESNPAQIRFKAERFNQANILKQWEEVYSQVLNL